MDKSMLLEVIGDTIENRIVDFLLEGRGMDYTKTDIAENCGISRPTLYKAFPKLLKSGIIKKTRLVGTVQLYSIDEKSGKVKALMKLEEYLLKDSFEEKQKIKVSV